MEKKEKAEDIKNNIDDLVSKSKKISKPGRTAYYKLVTQVQSLDKEGKLQKVTFGNKDPNKPNKTILLVGETGKGKSTMINTMVNYVLGIELEHEVWFEVVEDKSQHDENKTKTSEITVYEIFGHEGHVVPYSLTIIDTPGYGNTSGIHMDKIVAKKCLELFRSVDGIQEIHSVAIVVMASVNRFTDRQHYQFDAVLSMFGKDMENNFVYFLTFSNGNPPWDTLQALENAKIPCAKDNKNEPMYFLFDNQKVIDTSGMSAREAERAKKTMTASWRTTRYGLEDFSEFLKTVKPQSVKMSERVLRERKALVANINNLSEKVSFLQQKQQQLRVYEEEVQKCQEDLNDTTPEVEKGVSKKFKEDVDHWVTSCKTCEENCNSELWWVSNLWRSKVIKDDKCTVCTGGCNQISHVHEKKKYVKEKQTIKMKENVENKLKLESDIRTKSENIGEIKEKLVMTEKDIDKFLEDSYNCVVELDIIALKATSMSMVEPVNLLIQWMTEKEGTDKVVKLKEIQKRFDKINKEGLSYFRIGWNIFKDRILPDYNITAPRLHS